MLIKIPFLNVEQIGISYRYCFLLAFLIPLIVSASDSEINNKYVIDVATPFIIQSDTWGTAIQGGDTIFVDARRTKAIKFVKIEGEQNNPIVIINTGGQVAINDLSRWGAITFENCKYIKITGDGHASYKYGFLLAASTCGLAFSELSSDCEAGFIKISHKGFFGIMAKKNYEGNPPSPVPIFSNLLIHDCFIENVTEGMYLGETKSPGMEFKHVQVYNNIVKNTGRESIQIANMVEDIKIYNNTLLNAGIDEETWQGNILQIGDNSVADVYNNILQGGNSYGIISFGMGNNNLYNNFISSCKGIFTDSRLFTLKDSFIVISENYFKDIIYNENEVIRNMNGVNELIIENNKYDDDDALFYRNYYKSNQNYILKNNISIEIAPIQFTNVAENDYSLSLGNPAAYQDLGAPGGPEYLGELVTAYEGELVSEQIVLSANMIVDEVDGGSYWAANYLVDEQTLTPETGEHPISQSWKPYWNMNKGPYHIYVDLGAEYFLTTIALHDMHDTKNLEISIGEPGNWQPLFTETCDKYKTWKEHEVSVATQYVRLSMTESVFAAVNELVLFGYKVEQPESVQIELNAEMVVDEVEGGSYWSANYLVDEQTLTPETKEHPTSQSWKPFWNMDKGPYHVYLDLGKEYTITEIALHDMHDTKNLDVSVGDPGNWELLFTESCDKYKTWKQHETNVKTRYIRLSMTESVFAAVNEIILYGYADGEEVVAEKSAGATSTSQKELTTGIETKLETEELFLCENPVKRSLKLNVPASLNNNFRIEIFSINGARLYSEKYIESSTSQLTIDVSEYCAKSGVYLMRYSNNEGTAKCLKFVKKEY